MRAIATCVLCLLSGSSLAQSNSVPMGCAYPKNGPDQAVAENIMPLALPYLDNQLIHYRDDSGQSNGSYAVRRSLRIYFYNKNNVLMGIATRRSQQVTSYFDPNWNYLGDCVNHKLVQPDQRPVRFDPTAK